MEQPMFLLQKYSKNKCWRTIYNISISEGGCHTPQQAVEYLKNELNRNLKVNGLPRNTKFRIIKRIRFVSVKNTDNVVDSFSRKARLSNQAKYNKRLEKRKLNPSIAAKRRLTSLTREKARLQARIAKIEESLGKHEIPLQEKS